MRSFLGRDILSLKDMEREEFFQIFRVADRLRPYAAERRNGDLLKHKTLLTAFYQPSTRTRLATEAAMHRLGGHVLGFSDAKMTRAGDFYQESIKDTVHMLEYYGDVIAMRHFQQGAPAEAAKWASVPVINCGDGWGEHPTQVLTDLYTIWQQKGTLDGLKVLLRRRHADAHDALDPLRDVAVRHRGLRRLARRTCRSCAEFKAELDARNVQYRESESVATASPTPTSSTWSPSCRPTTPSRAWRPPRARAHAGRLPGDARAAPRRRPSRDAIILHSLPRMDELPPDVDSTRHARYWVEAFNGVVMRMALLSLVLGATE